MSCALTRVQREVLSVVVEKTQNHGPLMVSQIQEFMERDPRHTLRELLYLGYLRQTTKGGPYLPSRDIDGTPLRLELVRGGETREGEYFAARVGRMSSQERADMSTPTDADVRGELWAHLEGLRAQERQIG